MAEMVDALRNDSNPLSSFGMCHCLSRHCLLLFLGVNIARHGGADTADSVSAKAAENQRTDD